MYTRPLERRFVPLEERTSDEIADGQESGEDGGNFLRPALSKMRSAGSERGVVLSVRRDSIDKSDSGLSDFSYFS